MGSNPGLKAVLAQGAGQSNIRKVSVALPLSLALDAENASGDWLCDFEAGKQADCPASSIIGKATASTPLLNRPLTGSVFFVKNVRFSKIGRAIRTLPTLLMKLRGEVAINLRATSSVKGGKLVSTFATVPDARISKFTLQLKGGSKRGILAVTGSKSLCKANNTAQISFTGQNGKTYKASPKIATGCKAKGQGKKSRKR